MVKKIFLLVSVFSLFISCQWFEKKATFKFENVSIEQSLSECDTEDCPVVSLNYLKSTKPTNFSQQFNDTIHKRLLALLQTSKEEPKTQNYDLDKAIQLYFAEYQELKKIFPEMPAYELNVVDSISFANDTLVSLKSSVYSYSGGTHGYQSVTFLNFNSLGRCYTNKDLFTNIDSVTNVAERYFRQAENIQYNELLNEKGFWFENNQFALPENIGFEKDSLILYYNPYEITSYSEGAKIIKIPLDKIKKWIFYNNQKQR